MDGLREVIRMTHKNGYCPACDAERELELKVVEQTFPVRGEPIKVEAEVAFCAVCGGEVPDREMDFAALERAYAEYRRLKGIPTPRQKKRINPPVPSGSP